MTKIHHTAAIVATLITLVACATTPAPPTTDPTPEVTPITRSGLTITPAPSWSSEPPTSPFRAAQFLIDPASPDTRLIVYYFGTTGAGAIEMNITRWLGQFEYPGGATPDLDTALTKGATNGMPAWTLDVEGTYIAETSPGSGQRHNAPDHRMLATIIETKAGLYYFKLVGPKAILAKHKPAYDAFIANLAPAPIDPSHEPPPLDVADPTPESAPRSAPHSAPSSAPSSVPSSAPDSY